MTDGPELALLDYYSANPRQLTNQDLDPTDTEEDETQSIVRSKRKKRKWPGWRSTVLIGTIVIALVMALNIAMLIVAFLKPHDGGNAILYSGGCGKMETVFTYSHLAINILSTALLSASNAAMQCLAAPTRLEIDHAQAKKKWLDIGAFSFRNLRSIKKQRCWLWFYLLLSFLPLHLL
jgi:hypothetical protein